MTNEPYFYSGRLAKRLRETANFYAVCHTCHRVFYDDVLQTVDVACPFCRLDGDLHRGLSRDDANQYVHVPIEGW